MANKHLLPADEFTREKARLELAAAEILRSRDGKRHDDVKKQARAEKRAAAEPTLASKNPALMGALMGGAAVAFFALLGWQLTQSATEKPEGMGGSRAEWGPAAAVPCSSRKSPRPTRSSRRLAARVQANPEDVDAVADLAMHLIRRQAFDEARPLVDRATFLDPFHPKGRVGRAVVRALEGDLKGSIDDLEALASRYPEAYDARMFAGMLAMEDNDQRRALMNLEAYVSARPARRAAADDAHGGDPAQAAAGGAAAAAVSVAWFSRLYRLNEAGRFDEVVTASKKYLVARPKDYALHLQRAKALLSLGASRKRALHLDAGGDAARRAWPPGRGSTGPRSMRGMESARRCTGRCRRRCASIPGWSRSSSSSPFFAAHWTSRPFRAVLNRSTRPGSAAPKGRAPASPPAAKQRRAPAARGRTRAGASARRRGGG